MFTWMQELIMIDKVFAWCAMIGGLIFGVRLLMQLVGATVELGDVSAEVDADIDIDAEAGGHSDMHGASDSDTSFRLLSIQFITSFLLLFGLVGLWLSWQQGLPSDVALIGASAAGVAMGLLMERIMRLFQRLQHAGNVDLRHAIGSVGQVYCRIPADGVGRVQVPVQGRLLELDARSSAALETGRAVIVTALEGEVLQVEPHQHQY